MIKQIDRVIGDLVKQAAHFKRGAGNPICVGIVGINHAAAYTSYEGHRAWPPRARRATGALFRRHLKPKRVS